MTIHAVTITATHPIENKLVTADWRKGQDPEELAECIGILQRHLDFLRAPADLTLALKSQQPIENPL
jgi:hypothetical protein